MKAAIAVAAVVALAVLTTVALYQAIRWLAALRERNWATPEAYRSERTRLVDERRRLLNHLREIRFDHDTGKIDVADYEAMRTRYEREALAVLAALDALDAASRSDGGRSA